MSEETRRRVLAVLGISASDLDALMAHMRDELAPSCEHCPHPKHSGWCHADWCNCGKPQAQPAPAKCEECSKPSTAPHHYTCSQYSPGEPSTPPSAKGAVETIPERCHHSTHPGNRCFLDPRHDGRHLYEVTPESLERKLGPPITIWIVDGHADIRWVSGFWDVNPANGYKYIRADEAERWVAEALARERERAESAERELCRLRELEMSIVQDISHLVEGGDDKGAIELVRMLRDERDTAERELEEARALIDAYRLRMTKITEACVEPRAK